MTFHLFYITEIIFILFGHTNFKLISFSFCNKKLNQL